MSGAGDAPPHRRGSGASLAVDIAQLRERVEGIAKAVEGFTEIRDVVIGMSAVMEKQDVGAQIAELRRDVGVMTGALRDDVVNANTALKRDMQEETAARRDADVALEQRLDARLKLLEAQRDKVAGGAALVAWLIKAAPWLVGPAIGAAVARFLDFNKGGS